MPDTTSNSNLSNFLYTLRKEIGVSDSGSATIDQVKSALKGYGYIQLNRSIMMRQKSKAA